MKRYVKASIPNNVPTFTIDITVFHELITDMIAAAFSNIKPIYSDELELDEKALAEYDDFIDELIGEIEYQGFKLLRASESESSATSRYYTLADKNQIANKDIKFLVFLRVSDHHPKLDENQKAWVRNQREKDRERFKQPQTKASQRFKVRSLLVNGEEFESYDSAMEYAVKKLEEWHNSIL